MPDMPLQEILWNDSVVCLNAPFIVLKIDEMSEEQHGDVTQSIYSGLLAQHGATSTTRR